MAKSGGNKASSTPPSAIPAVNAVNIPTAYEVAKGDAFKEFNAYRKKDGGDILGAPGMNRAVDNYASADLIAAQQRLGVPSFALSGGGSGDYAKQVDVLQRRNLYNDRARGISQAYNDLEAQADGFGMNAAEMETRRRNSFADSMLRQEGQYYNRPAKQNWFQKYAMPLIGAGIGGLAGRP